MNRIYKTSLLFSLLLASTNLCSQLYYFNWVQPVGGSAGSDIVSKIAIDATSDVISTGFFSGTVDFDSGSGTFTLAPSGNFIRKVDVVGNFQWAKLLGGNLSIIDLKTDASNNIYLTGSFSGTADFDPNPTSATATAVGSVDVFIIKLNSLGNLQWFKTFGGTSIEAGRSISVDASGNVFITGNFQGTVDFDPSAATTNISALGSSDIFISKFNSSGNFSWVRAIGSVAGEMGYSIALDASGDAYVAGGYSSSALDFDAGIGTTTLVTSGLNDVFITKYTSIGNFAWARGFGSVNNDLPNAITVDVNNNVYTTGYYTDITDFDTGTGTLIIGSNGVKDIFIHKLNASGVFQWAKTFGGISNDEPRGISTDAAGNVYTTGSFGDVVDFDPGATSHTISGSVANLDAFISKLDGQGDFIWAGGLLGSSFNNIGYSIATNATNAIYVGGSFRNTVDFDPALTTNTITSLGSEDSFLLKLLPCVAPASPSNTTSSNLLTICEGDGASLSVSSIGTVNWYSSATSTNVLISGYNYSTPTLSPGTYTYYADATTCTISANRTALTVTVNPKPNIIISSSNPTICTGESATLSATGASAGSYSWSTSNLSSSIVVSPTTNVTYTVSGSLLGCSNIANITQSVNECVGLFENAKLAQLFSVYPNPTSSMFSIKSAAPLENLLITDATGKKVINYVIDRDAETHAFDLKELPAGIYFLTITIANQKAHTKLIKQ